MERTEEAKDLIKKGGWKRNNTKKVKKLKHVRKGKEEEGSAEKGEGRGMIMRKQNCKHVRKRREEERS